MDKTVLLATIGKSMIFSLFFFTLVIIFLFFNAFAYTFTGCVSVHGLYFWILMNLFKYELILRAHEHFRQGKKIH